MLDSLRLGLNALFAPQTCGLCDVWVLNHRLIPLCNTCRGGLTRINGPVLSLLWDSSTREPDR